MVFEQFVASIRNRTTRSRHKQSQQPRSSSAFVVRDEREESPVRPTAPIVPMTPAAQTTPNSKMTNQQKLENVMKQFAGMRKSESRQALILPQVPHLKPMTFSNLSHIIPEEENDDPFGVKKPIVRKPLSPDSPFSPKPFAHQARAGLRTRYESKIEVEGKLLEKKVEEDIEWVVKVWEKAGKGRPSDGDIVGFYDLWSYVEEEEARARPRSAMV